MFKHSRFLFILPLALALNSCKVPSVVSRPEHRNVPEAYGAVPDTGNIAQMPWKSFFADKYLTDLIETALQNNQELNIVLQEIEMSRNDIRMRKGAILPMVRAGAGIELEKVGRYTSQGAGDVSTEITPGVEVPEWLLDYAPTAYAHWEVDIWKKLRNAKKAAVSRYLATIEGKNFVITNLIAEIADSYYELLALDAQLQIVRQNIALQKDALEIVKIQKASAQTTELAVQKFQAEVLSTQSLEFEVLQDIKATENRINFLLGRFPQEIPRDNTDFLKLTPAEVQTGIPAQLLENRPDIKQAELELAAARIDVNVARAEFYPSLDISAAIGLQAFKPSYLVKFPESLLFTLAGDLAGTIINRNAIKAEFLNANARQIQAIYQYERTILNAYLEVSTTLSNRNNLEQRYRLKSQQVETLNQGISISNDLFRSARVDYFEVLMTQRDALESKLELLETKKQQFASVIQIYRELGGGWR